MSTHILRTLVIGCLASPFPTSKLPAPSSPSSRPSAPLLRALPPPASPSPPASTFKLCLVVDSCVAFPALPLPIAQAVASALLVVLAVALAVGELPTLNSM
ncbi:hypothetical protein KC19_VG099700 [Ceratodon purpureus]|uniref:Uncharacterized protein n=1 Tax=Ceratodon purpureus TaxID=3225 RepID=A0A8T0HNX2_CERPU|nr:hypothetical protein KC19_VG099700 [Ceratodon purpureus]